LSDSPNLANVACISYLFRPPVLLHPCRPSTHWLGSCLGRFMRSRPAARAPLCRRWVASRAAGGQPCTPDQSRQVRVRWCSGPHAGCLQRLLTPAGPLGQQHRAAQRRLYLETDRSALLCTCAARCRRCCWWPTPTPTACPPLWKHWPACSRKILTLKPKCHKQN